MTCRCPTCGGAINYRAEEAGTIEACPHCAARLTLPASADAGVATIRTTRRGGLWTLARILGGLIFVASFAWLLLLVFTGLAKDTSVNRVQVVAFASIPAVLGMLVGAALSALGRRGGIAFVCSNCGKPVARTAGVCANCGAAFAAATA